MYGVALKLSSYSNNAASYSDMELAVRASWYGLNCGKNNGCLVDGPNIVKR